MATIASTPPYDGSGETFFRRIALVMGLFVVAGFSVHYLAGRSSFIAQPLVHLHGMAFMGWVALFVMQARLATLGPIALHRRLG